MNQHSYIFFDSRDAISLSPSKIKAAKAACAKFCSRQKKVGVEAFGTLGFKAGTRFMLHIRAEEASDIQKFVNGLMHTDLGKHLIIRDAYFGMRRPSPYNPNGTMPDEHELNGAYLILYPFVKTIEWHLKPQEERGAIMKDHVAVGKKYSDNISQLLLYSYGLDDQEFIVSYSTDSLQDFQTLVMELRGTEARRYTERDTPIYLCIKKTISEALDLV